MQTPHSAQTWEAHWLPTQSSAQYWRFAVWYVAHAPYPAFHVEALPTHANEYNNNVYSFIFYVLIIEYKQKDIKIYDVLIICNIPGFVGVGGVVVVVGANKNMIKA